MTISRLSHQIFYQSYYSILSKRLYIHAVDKLLMSKKKKKDRNLQGKVLSIFKNNPNQSFNHKQIAARLDVKDTNIKNAIIKSLGKFCSQKILWFVFVFEIF